MGIFILERWHLYNETAPSLLMLPLCDWLTCLPLDKMAAVLQTIFSDAFSWMKIFVFWLKFHWILFLRVQLTIWGYPPTPTPIPPPPQSYKFKEFAKISHFWILKHTLHLTHLPKLLDKMCKYEMELMSIVENTEQAQFCPQQMGGRTVRQMDKVKPVYPPFNFVEAGVIVTQNWFR